MNRIAVANELVKLARELVARDLYRFENLNGGIPNIFFTSASFGEKGTRISVGMFSGGDGGEFTNLDLPYSFDREQQDRTEKLRKELESEIAREAEIFDKKIASILAKRGFKQGR